MLLCLLSSSGPKIQKLGDHGQLFHHNPARVQPQNGDDQEVRRVGRVQDTEEVARPQGIRKGGWDESTASLKAECPREVVAAGNGGEETPPGALSTSSITSG